MKAIMYHYVRPYDPDFPGLKNLNINDFRKQLDYLEKKFGFISQKNFFKCIQEKKPIDGIILTFDDGLKCHYKYVFQELLKRSLWGIFYISSGPYTKKKILDVHKTHILLSKISAQKVNKRITSLISEEDIDNQHKSAFESLTYKSQINDDYTLLVKRTINYYLKYESKEEILANVFESFGLNEKELLKEYYLSLKEIKEMHNAGMIIGSHSVNHPVMARLSDKNQLKEVLQSKHFLEGVIKPQKINTFCYPYGGQHSYNTDTLDILESLNFKFSFSVEPRDIIESDFLNGCNSLPRYDCNRFPYGQVREAY